MNRIFGTAVAFSAAMIGTHQALVACGFPHREVVAVLAMLAMPVGLFGHDLHPVGATAGIYFVTAGTVSLAVVGIPGVISPIVVICIVAAVAANITSLVWLSVNDVSPEIADNNWKIEVGHFGGLVRFYDHSAARRAQRDADPNRAYKVFLAYAPMTVTIALALVLRRSLMDSLIVLAIGVITISGLWLIVRRSQTDTSRSPLSTRG